MNRHILFVTAIIISLNAIATSTDNNSNDTTYKELKEFVVEGQSSFITDNGMIFIPNKQVKNASNDVISLLRNMAIPVLQIDPLGNSVKNISNSDVSIFIDFQPATQQEILGMRTKDVVRVEYYDNPTDPRFKGSRAVVNFIMKKYQYGGYLKLNAGQSFFYNAGDYRLYSKISHKRMTYDISLGAKYAIDNGKRESSLHNYHFVDDFAKKYTIQRISEGKGRDKSNTAYASFRARYSTNKILISNEIGLNGKKKPYSFINGEVAFNSLPYGDFNNNNTSQSLSPYFSGNYFFVLSNRSTLSASVNFSYSRNKSWQNYISGNSEPIVNNSDEHVYSPNISINYNYNLGHNNSFNLDIWSANNIYKSDYRGSFEGKQSFITSDNLIIPSYTHRIGNKINLYARLGLLVSTFDVNDKKILSTQPTHRSTTIVHY